MPPIRRYHCHRAIAERAIIAASGATAATRLRVRSGSLSVQDFLDGLGANDGVVVLGNNNRVVVNGVDFGGDLHEEDVLEDPLEDRRAYVIRRRGAAPYHPSPAPIRGPRAANVRLTDPLVITPEPAPRMTLTNFDSLCEETNHLASRLRVYDLDHVDGVTAYVAVLDGVGHQTVGKLIQLWHKHATAPDGLYRTWNRMLADPRFAASAGPLSLRKRSDMTCLAASASFNAGRGHGLARVGDCIPTNAIRKCSSLLSLREGAVDSYDRALATAATIVEAHQLAGCDDHLSIDEIMEYDIYTRFQNVHLSHLTSRGIISHNSHAVGSANDLQDAVLLPMFLALDSLYPANIWRRNCLVRNINVPPIERAQIDSNTRLHDEVWP
jgi:hypothetical protein